MLVAPRTDPDGRLLAHPVLIADDWRQSELRERDGACAVEEAVAVVTVNQYPGGDKAYGRGHTCKLLTDERSLS